MGQEYGHAYEDLLDLALLEILPKLATPDCQLRISSERGLKGVSGNIDHLIEFFNLQSNQWEPYLLFLEKHSDSEAHSRPAFRRHLEEYIQAKVSSVLNFSYNSTNTLPIINLIYGTKTGWRKIILEESKRLLQPTLYLVELGYYDTISALIEESVSESYPDLNRSIIRQKLSKKLKKNQAFLLFQDTLVEYIEKAKVINPEIQDWISNEISRAREISLQNICQPCSSYIRRNLTELLILPSSTRAKVLDVLIDSNQSKFKLGKHFSIDDFRLIQMSFSGASVTRSILGYQLNISPIMQSLPRENWVRRAIEISEDLFFRNFNHYKIKALSYLGYFDIRSNIFIQIASDACIATLSLLNGESEELVRYLMRKDFDSEFQGMEKAENIFQNIYLESIMSLASYAVRTALKIKKKDLSSPVLSRLSKISKSKVDQARRQVITDISLAQCLAEGVTAFYQENILNKDEIINIINHEIGMLHKWRTFNYQDNSSKYPEIPNILNPQSSMSLVWTRQNQVNSHLLFNPLFALVYKWASSTLGNEFSFYGFPSSSDANPLKVVLGSNYDGAEYEFSLVCWDQKKRFLHIFESSSVIDFKHTSDKCKELCARIRIVRGVLFSHCHTSFHLIIDGDWQEKHIFDLQMAGWDEVIYSRDFIKTYFSK